MRNRDLLVKRLGEIPYVKTVSLGQLPSDKADLHSEPALMLRCNFNDLAGGPRAEMYLQETMLDNLESHDSIVNNVDALYQRFNKPRNLAEGSDPSAPADAGP